MNQISIQYYKSPIGEIILGDYQGKLCLADWKYRRMRPTIDKRIQVGLNATYSEQPTPLINETIIQFQEYFKEKRTKFTIPLLFLGTDFQKQVWNALLQIPFGETSSYLKLAQDLGNEKAIRAVASANGANAISIIVPCHRIIGSDGDMVGYAGGLAAKKKLLQLEKAEVMNQMSLF